MLLENTMTTNRWCSLPQEQQRAHPPMVPLHQHHHQQHLQETRKAQCQVKMVYHQFLLQHHLLNGMKINYDA